MPIFVNPLAAHILMYPPQKVETHVGVGNVDLAGKIRSILVRERTEARSSFVAALPIGETGLSLQGFSS